MFNPKAFENSRPDGFPVLEIVSPDVPESTGRTFVPLKHTRLGGEVAGPLAALTLTQTFGYTRAQSEKTLEAMYRFPLPGDAAVMGVQVRFGDVQITAELKERQEAETEYQEAVQQGRQAALATRESPDVFTLRVAGLQPDQEITVETSYVQLARSEGSHWTLRIPLTTSPRYVRADEAKSRHAQGQPLVLLRDPGHRFTLDVNFESVSDVKSATHPLTVQQAGGNSQRVQLRDGDVLPDRDCVLSWKSLQEPSQPGLTVLLHDDAQTGYTYFLALLAPSKAQPVNTDVPREVVLLVDHSGSMNGAKWEAADWAVKQFLGNLTEQDAFALGLFHSTTKWFSHGGLYGTAPHAATTTDVANAVTFLEENRDSGGTELGVALEQALGLRRAGGERARHVLIVTDAEVSDGGRLLRMADTEAATPERRRVSVLCIDAAPNAFLASELAERGGGISKFLTSAPEEEDITTALDAVLEDFAQPVLANLRLEVDRPHAEASGRGVLASRNPQSSAIDLGDLPRGRAVWVAGRVKRGESPDLKFTVTVGGRDVAAVQAHVTPSEASRPALKALFGARRILALEYLITSHHDQNALTEQLTRLGYDPKAALSGAAKNTVYAENAAAPPTEALKQLLVKEALEYGLASSETAFVAVRTEAGKPVEGTVAVANALPSGWSETFSGYYGSYGAAPAGGAMPMSAMSLAMPSPVSPPHTRGYSNVDYDTKSSLSESSPASPPPPTAAQRSRGLFGFAKRDQTGSAAKPKQAPASPPAASSAPEPFDFAPGSASAFDAIKEALAAPTVGNALYAGVPAFAGTEAVLFDTSRASDASKLPNAATFTRLEVRFPGGSLDLNTLSQSLTLLLFVDDMAQPRARVRLVDLLRQGGSRPLNVQRQAGQPVRIVLVDDSGKPSTLPAMEVALRW